jgi:hypothetical protein
MKDFCKYIENRWLLLQVEKTDTSFDILIYHKDYLLFWWRNCFKYKYFELILFNKKIIYLNFRNTPK